MRLVNGCGYFFAQPGRMASS